MSDWVRRTAERINSLSRSDLEDVAVIEKVIRSSMPEPPLLQCVSCHNTESCAGAMAREHWHPGRCMHCGGNFKVVRA